METGFRHLPGQGIELPGLTSGKKFNRLQFFMLLFVFFVILGYTYLGVSLSFFPIHKEDSDLISLNYSHEVGGKFNKPFVPDCLNTCIQKYFVSQASYGSGSKKKTTQDSLIFCRNTLIALWKAAPNCR